MRTLIQDVRYAWRALRRTPGFTAAAIIALALGIGANTAIFSVANAVLLRPLAYAAADRLVEIWENQGRPVAYPNYIDWRNQSDVFEKMAAWGVFGSIVSGQGRPAERAGIAYVSTTFLSVFQVQPILGRDFVAAEESQAAPATAILSHSFWQSRFGGDPGVLGKSVAIDRRGFTVIGVLPAEFKPYRKADVYAPIATVLQRYQLLRRDNRDTICVIARRKPGAAIEKVQAQMDAIAARLDKQYPDSHIAGGPSVKPLRETLTGSQREPILILLGTVGFVLLIACVNVANLLLARGAARRREIAIRTALGAGRGRVIRQLLTESVLLAAFGGASGLMLAWLSFAGLMRLVPSAESVGALSLDARVLSFTLLLSVFTGLLFGLAPAARASSAHPGEALKAGAAAGTGPRNRLRSGLVIAEVALACVLCLGAGLLLRSYERLARIDPGFRPEQVTTLRITLAASNDQPLNYLPAFYQRVVERVEKLPGVSHAGLCRYIPFSGGMSSGWYYRPDRPAPPQGKLPSALWKVATPGFFPAMGIPLLAGRYFSPSDGVTPAIKSSEMGAWLDRAQLVAVISKSMADEAWPGEDAVGKHFIFGQPATGGPPITVLGVVGDAKHGSLNSPAPPIIYFSGYQVPDNGLYLAVRSAGNAAPLISAVRNIVLECDRDAAVTEVRSMEEMVSGTLSGRRVNLVTLGIFAGLALLLAAIGIYGVIAYTVVQRTREIGLRIALGASQRAILAGVLKEAGVLAGAGVVIGVAGGLALTRAIRSMLFGVSASDPVTFAGVAAFVLALALLASFVPARRAMKVEPALTLRHE